MSEKTHDPTAKRVREARAKGDVPYAPLVAVAVSLIALPAIGRSLVVLWYYVLTAGLRGELTPDPWPLAGVFLRLALPGVGLLAALSVLSAVAQGAVTIAPAKLALDPSRLDLVGGLGRLVDRSRAFGVLRGLLATALIGLFTYGVVREAIVAGARASGQPGAIAVAFDVATRVLLVAGGCAAALAVLDVLVSRHLWLARHRMSRDEVTREHRESDGDPELRRRRDELHHELLAAEAVIAVRGATVVVVNPTHLACALRYDGKDDDEAPTLVAKGSGALAARIVEAARAHGVPIVRDVPVARALLALEVGTEIPEALYEAVAEVLSMATND